MTTTLERPLERTAPPALSRSRSPWLAKGVVNGLLILVTLYTFLPITWHLIAATKNTRDLFAHAGFEFGEFNLFANLELLFTWQDGIFLRWLGNSVLYSVVGSFLATLIAVVTGYAIDKYDFPGKEKVFGLILLGVLVPSTVLSLPLYLLVAEVGLVNTYWSILLPSLASPFSVYLARMFSQGYVPGEVIEAARMDGASEMTILRRIALPMMKPGFMTIFLLSFTGSFNSFFGPLIMLSDQHLYPVALGLFTWNSLIAQEFQYYVLVIVGALITIVPMLIAFISLQRYWRSGLTAGAVK